MSRKLESLTDGDMDDDQISYQDSEDDFFKNVNEYESQSVKKGAMKPRKNVIVSIAFSVTVGYLKFE